jgi:hypothetical protein
MSGNRYLCLSRWMHRGIVRVTDAHVQYALIVDLDMPDAAPGSHTGTAESLCLESGVRYRDKPQARADCRATAAGSSADLPTLRIGALGLVTSNAPHSPPPLAQLDLFKSNPPVLVETLSSCRPSFLLQHLLHAVSAVVTNPSPADPDTPRCKLPPLPQRRHPRPPSPQDGSPARRLLPEGRRPVRLLH